MKGMPRTLNERDIGILKKLAPELSDLVCAGSGHEFHSILPPVSNHVVQDEKDFAERIRRLSEEDLAYLAERIIDGSESLGCMPPEDVESLAVLMETRLSTVTAARVREIYGMGEECVITL